MTYKITAVWEQMSGDEQVGELEVEIEFNWHKGSKSTWTDPGNPAFAELQEIRYESNLDKFWTYPAVWDWAESWLEDHQDLAAQVVREDYEEGQARSRERD